MVHYPHSGLDESSRLDMMTSGLYGGTLGGSIGGQRSNSSASSAPSPPLGTNGSSSLGSMLAMHPTKGDSHYSHHAAAAAMAAAAAGLAPPHLNGSGNNGGGPSNGSRKYQCKMCPQIFGSKADLQLHTQVHMREAKPYKCSQCSKAFANSSYLSQHTRIHLGIKPYRCEICQRKFTQLSHLQQHIRTHTGDKPYRCRNPGCTKAFSQLSNLQSHSRCHQTDKPYKCNSCYKCFVDETALLEHIPKHKESKHLKTHICQYCGKSYTQETYLAKHMQKHSDRNDKRPPIMGVPGMLSGTGLGGSPPDSSYWPKMDPGAYQPLHDTTRIGSSDYHSQTVSSLIDPRLGNHQHHRDQMLIDPRIHPQNNHQHQTLSQLDDLRQHSVMGGGQLSANHLAGYQTGVAADSSTPSLKTSASAFSPIQGSVGSGMFSSAAGNFAAAARGCYSFYDHAIPFPKHHSQMGAFESKSATAAAAAAAAAAANCFPNQLISLSQIRNYAHQPGPPSMTSSLQNNGENYLLQSLKERVISQH